ncbi:MAG: GLPGLI family protein [Bacteroidales bacterium]
MKRFILLFGVTCCGTLLLAQQRDLGFLLSGTVLYEQTDQLNIQLEGDAGQLADALPKERKSQKVLHFTGESSLYENNPSESSEEPMEMHSGGGMMVRMIEPENKVFTNLKTGHQIEQKEFMSRMFLIESVRPEWEWRLTGQQKKILDYPCQEAISTREGDEVVAWFTAAVAVEAGPEEFGNLPGLILEVNIDEGEHVIKATSVELKTLEKGVLKKPSKGKAVTSEEYQAIVAEKMKEMGMDEGSSGGDHTVVIRIEAN